MTLSIILDENEKKVSAISLAHEIIGLHETGDITQKDLRELVAYLSVYNDYNGGRKDR